MAVKILLPRKVVRTGNMVESKPKQKNKLLVDILEKQLGKCKGASGIMKARGAVASAVATYLKKADVPYLSQSSLNNALLEMTYELPIVGKRVEGPSLRVGFKKKGILEMRLNDAVAQAFNANGYAGETISPKYISEAQMGQEKPIASYAFGNRNIFTLKTRVGELSEYIRKRKLKIQEAGHKEHRSVIQVYFREKSFIAP